MTHASPALSAGHKANFNNLLRAAKNRDLALMSCTDASTGEPVATVCMVNRDAEGNVAFAPVAKLFNSNPYEELLPPSI
jgi:hypothetical protein